jgi:hypothetical protein
MILYLFCLICCAVGLPQNYPQNYPPRSNAFQVGSTNAPGSVPLGSLRPVPKATPNPCIRDPFKIGCQMTSSFGGSNLQREPYSQNFSPFQSFVSSQTLNQNSPPFQSFGSSQRESNPYRLRNAIRE